MTTVQKETTRVKAYWRDKRKGQSAEPAWGTITARRGIYYDIKFDNGKYQRKIPKDWVKESLGYVQEEQTKKPESPRMTKGTIHRAQGAAAPKNYGFDDDDEDPLKKYGKPGLRIQSIFALPGGPVFGETGEVRALSDKIPGKVRVRFLKSGEVDMWPWQLQRIEEADKHAPGWTSRGYDAEVKAGALNGNQRGPASKNATQRPPVGSFQPQHNGNSDLYDAANGDDKRRASPSTNRSNGYSDTDGDHTNNSADDDKRPLGDRLLDSTRQTHDSHRNGGIQPTFNGSSYSYTKPASAAAADEHNNSGSAEDENSQFKPKGFQKLKTPYRPGFRPRGFRGALGGRGRSNGQTNEPQNVTFPPEDAQGAVPEAPAPRGSPKGRSPSFERQFGKYVDDDKPKTQNGNAEQGPNFTADWNAPVMDEDEKQAVVVATVWVCPKCRWENGAKRENCQGCNFAQDGPEIQQAGSGAVIVYTGVMDDGEEIEIEINNNAPTELNADNLFGAEPQKQGAKQKVTKRQLRIAKEAQRKLRQNWEFRHDSNGNYIPTAIRDRQCSRAPSVTETEAMREALDHLEAMMPHAPDDSDVVSIDTEIKPGVRIKLRVIAPGQYGRVDRHIVLRGQSRWGVTLDNGKRYAVGARDMKIVNETEAPPDPHRQAQEGVHLWRNVQPEVTTKLEHKLLFAAAREGHLDEVRRLIDMGVDLEAQDPTCHDYTALHHATWRGHGSGRVVNCPGNHGLERFQTPTDTYYCDICGAENFKKGSVMYGCKDCHWDVCPECVKPSYSVVALLITSKANIETRDRSGNTPLLVACAKGHDNCVTLLINGRANVNTPDHNGWTPLMVAARYGQESCVKLLLNSRANLQLKNKEGAKAIQFGKHFRQKEVVRLIQECCTNCSATGQVGFFKKGPCPVCGGSGYASKMTPLESAYQQTLQGNKVAGRLSSQ